MTAPNVMYVPFPHPSKESQLSIDNIARNIQGGNRTSADRLCDRRDRAGRRRVTTRNWHEIWMEQCETAETIKLRYGCFRHQVMEWTPPLT